MKASLGQKRLLLSVARALQRRIVRPRGWDVVCPEFREGGEAYGWCPIFAPRGGEVALEVWLDRLFLRGGSKRPMLACSFSAEGDAGRDLYHGAPSDLRRVVYASLHRERAAAYDGVPVVERDAEGVRYLTLYLRPDELGVDLAVASFARYFGKFRWVAQDLTEFVPEGRAGIDSKEQGSAITRLLGELKILSTLPRAATWKGAGRGSYDIESGGYQIEVKAARGEPDAPALTLAQIRGGTTRRRIFALVSVPTAATSILEGAKAPRARGLGGIVAAREDEVREYLRGFGVRCTPELLARLSAALRYCRVGWYRLEPPDGWRGAVRRIQEFGKVRGLTIECPVREWFRRLRGCPVRARRR